MAGTSHGEPDHLVADAEPRDAGTDLGHRARQIAPLTRREGGREQGIDSAAADHRLTDVDTCRSDLDENLTDLRDGTRYVAHLEDVDIPVRIELPCSCHGPFSFEP